jgi:hypothetical protein
VVVGVRGSDIVAFAIDRLLTATTPVRIAYASNYAVRPQIATDGRNTLVAWQADFTRVYGLRLGPNLDVLDEAPRRLGETASATLAGVVWTGHDYLAIWQSWTGVYGARLHRDGRRSAAGLIEIAAPSSFSQYHGAMNLRVAALDGRVFLTWSQSGEKRMRRFVTIAGDEVTELLSTHELIDSDLRLVAAGDRLGYAVSHVDNAGPYYGSSRLMLALNDVAGLPPAAPALRAVATEADKVEVSWSAVPDSVNGYRLEARVVDGAWNEIERWFNRDERSLMVYLSEPGARVSFRVRAVNDAGPGPYSEEAVANAPRRRAIR